MEFRQLKAFLAVAGAGNFTRAAEMLDYAQSSITGQVSSLESATGDGSAVANPLLEENSQSIQNS